MGKSRQGNKEAKKPALLTPREKKAVRQAKKSRKEPGYALVYGPEGLG
jgi:hypothetical protein